MSAAKAAQPQDECRLERVCIRPERKALRAGGLLVMQASTQAGRAGKASTTFHAGSCFQAKSIPSKCWFRASNPRNPRRLNPRRWAFTSAASPTSRWSMPRDHVSATSPSTPHRAHPKPYLRDLPIDVRDGELQRRQRIVQLRAAEPGDAVLAEEEVRNACVNCTFAVIKPLIKLIHDKRKQSSA